MGLDTQEKLLFGLIGGVLAFLITLLIPLLTKFFGTNVKFPSGETLVVQVVLTLLLAALFGAIGAVGAFVGGPDTAAKAIFMGGGAQALLKEGFASVKASSQQPSTEGDPERSVHPALKAIATLGQSLVYRDWR
jgi:hypothetical protein